MSSDPNPSRNGNTEASSPQISADFLIGDVRTGLERIRTRLLDLTNRNKLLNFRHSAASSLRIVDVHLETVFKRLQEGEKLRFQAVPEPDVQLEEELTAARYAEQLGWRISHELSAVPKPATYDGSLPVLHYVEKLDTLFRKISSAARTAIEESGTNMLYLSMGFLEWYESDDSNQARQAPLVVVPVVMERRTGRGKAFSCELEYSGEDIETNLSLVEKMRRDFGFEIPLWEDEDTPETYFARFEDLLNVKKRWRIRREITLSLVSFGKLLMFRDLDPKNWPADSSLATHSIVRELFEGTKTSESGYAEEFPIDAPELKPELPPLIMDADSSQHSAMIQALRGANLVIEGPPGTGKSQTITNLIAAAMAKGKTVLFISEKLAALEVVRRRLDECGLGMFCLEIHSHKTRKGNLFSELADRLKRKDSFRDPPDLERHSVLADGKKRRLIEYVTLINKTVEPFQATIFDILWARERTARALPFGRGALANVVLPSLVSCSQTDYDRAEDFCRSYSQQLGAILASCERLEDHPWAWILKVLNFSEEEACLNYLEEFVRNVREAKLCLASLFDATGIRLSLGPAGLEAADRMLGALPSTDAGIIPAVLTACSDAFTRQALGSFVYSMERYQVSLGRVMSVAAKGEALLDAQTGEKLLQVSNSLHSFGFDACSVSDLKALFVSNVEAERVLSQTRSSFEALRSFFGWEPPIDAAAIAYLLAAADTLDSIPMDLLNFRMSTLAQGGVVAQLKAAKAEAESLRSMRSRLASTFSLSQTGIVTNHSELGQQATTIAQASFFQRFGKNYKDAVNAYKTLALSGKRTAREQMAQGLRGLSSYYKRLAEFTSNAAYKAILGSEFKATDTKWDELLRLATWYEEVCSTFPEHITQAVFFRELFFNARPEQIRKMKAGLPAVTSHRAQLETSMSRPAYIGQTFPNPRTIADQGGSFEDFVRALTSVNEAILTALNEIERIGVPETFAIRDLAPLLTTASEARYERSRIEGDQFAPRVLGADFKGVSTDVTPLRLTVKFADAIASNTLPQTAIDWVLCDDYESHLAQLRTWFTSARALLSTISTLRQQLSEIAYDHQLAGRDPETLELLAARALEARDELPRWIQLLRLRAEGAELGLQKLTAMANSGAFEPEHLLAAFAFVFYNSLARSVFSTHELLSQMTGMTLDQLRDQFAKADRDVIRLYRNRIAAIIDRRSIITGNKSGPVGTWTEYALLTHELNKQKRHIPIRRLLQRAGRTMLALKPCFMMGPLSVAQYLAPGGLKFDLVVMDEASQLRPEEAIGAIARGGQMIVVGDPKQLPPTTFFQRTQMEGDAADEDQNVAAVEEGESILDVASTLYQPVRRLRWHYRSRHHSLIAFSNREFYKEDLIIFPSAYREHSSLGVKYVQVPGAIFDERRNPREAEFVVDAMLEHMKSCPDESLGVVTLNFEQRELIEELFDGKSRNDPFALSYQEKMKGPDELFIKNLENVQGDERDVIFISVTYGPDALGSQYQRFGPINGENGHRRLNVLFTRAKKRVVVFSSLDAEKIQVSPTSAWGVRALKQYLTYARTGILDNSFGTSDQATNDFEKSVGAVLKEKGLEVVPQVGVAGFFIDLGVIHPTKPGVYLLGIECDGASYHSGRSARDRDRLRQEILESHGWKIYRIWSTDWYRSREKEIERLFKHIDGLLLPRRQPV
jgi:very-short-patch-repair endonuclease